MLYLTTPNYPQLDYKPLSRMPLRSNWSLSAGAPRHAVWLFVADLMQGRP